MPPFLISLLIQLAVGVGLTVLGYLLTPKPKGPKPNELEDLKNPTAEAGRPPPVVFGEVEVKGLNVVHFGNKNTVTREI